MGRDRLSELSEEFRVDVGLRQGSALSPLLFIAAVDAAGKRVQGTFSASCYIQITWQ